MFDSLSNASENRKVNLGKLIAKYYKNINDFCVQNGEDYSAIHRYLNGNLRIGNNVVKRFEKIFNLKSGELDKSGELREIIQIPIYSAKGSFTSVDNILSRLPNTHAHIEGFIFQEYGVEQKDAIGITYDNDSMYPDIKSGWSVLVDLSETEIQDGKIYALLVNTKILFRKVFVSLDSNKLTLKANNQDFTEVVLPIQEVTVIGQPKYILGGSFDK